MLRAAPAGRRRHRRRPVRDDGDRGRGRVHEHPASRTRGRRGLGHRSTRAIRHAVTKLAHVHFPATELARRRVIAMGEDPTSVSIVGCPRSTSSPGATDARPPRDVLEPVRRRGSAVDPSAFLLVMQHPVTTEYGEGMRPDPARRWRPSPRSACRRSCSGRTSTPARRTSPRGSGSSASSATTRTASTSSRTCRRTMFVKLMAHCACMVGNSSAAIREGAFLGTPAVTSGPRQHGRDRGSNLVEVGHDRRGDRRRDPRADGPRALREQSTSSATARRARRSPTSWSSCARRFRSG